MNLNGREVLIHHHYFQCLNVCNALLKKYTAPIANVICSVISIMSTWIKFILCEPML